MLAKNHIGKELFLSDLRFDLVFIFFIYGLAFFSMGIAMALETGRSPLLAERRALLPLAAFGLLHGFHEWVEIILLQGVWLGQPFPQELSWLRVIWLVISFVPLVAFGVLMSFPNPPVKQLFAIVSLGLLGLYLGSLWLLARSGSTGLIGQADALARYLLAVPGGVLAGWGLRARAKQVQLENRPKLARFFRWAALGFLIYGLTQVFVPPADLPLARGLNSAVFFSVFGFPVQLVRAAMAVLITVNLLRAVQFVEREREAQLVVAQQARLEALERIQRELEQREALRRELLRHIVIAQEDERARIARELHDETAQFLTALSLDLATLSHISQGERATWPIIQRLQGLTRQMSQGIYRLVHDLRPAQLDDLGLVPALQYLSDEHSHTGLKVSLSVDGPAQRLDPLVETVFFRVAQEALTNIDRHAHTDHAQLSLWFQKERVILEVKDDGVGFHNPNNAGKAGWGLAGMRERAESVGGELHLQSEPGKGTRVEVSIPIQEATLASIKEVVHEHDPLNVG
jgi:two-component system sensor histidine kinase UhpB